MSKKYECDGSTIMIGTKDFRVFLPNGYGDGAFTVRVIKTDKQKQQFYKQQDTWKWVGTVEGDQIHIWNYDCLDDKELTEDNILYTLQGRYAIYRNKGKIVLEEKWK